MKLSWILYKGQKHTRYILFLHLGSVGKKLSGLDAHLVGDEARAKILANKSFMDLSLYAKMNWIRRFCPDALKAYRELHADKILSSKEYKLQ